MYPSVLVMEFSRDPSTGALDIVSGGYSGVDPPVPIPNTEVKHARADGTEGETLRESRSPPDYSERAGEPPGARLLARTPCIGDNLS